MRGSAVLRNGPLPLRLLGTVALTGALAFLQVYSIQSVLPVWVAELGVSPVSAGATVGATVLAVALVSLFTGVVSDALGRKWLIVASALFLALSTLLLHGATSIEYIWWLRFLQGLAVPGITVVLIAYIGEEFDGSDRVRLMSLYVSGTILGGFLGRFLLGYLDEWLGWRHGMLVMALLNLLGAAVIARHLPSSRRFIAQAQGAGFAYFAAAPAQPPCVHRLCAGFLRVVFAGGLLYLH